jgi:hypothetical protein
MQREAPWANSGGTQTAEPRLQVGGLARRTAYYVTRARADGRHHRATDPTVLEHIRAVTNSRVKSAKSN